MKSMMMLAVGLAAAAAVGLSDAEAQSAPQGDALLSLQSKAVRDGGRTRVIVELRDDLLAGAMDDTSRRSGVRALTASVIRTAIPEAEAQGAGAVRRMSFLPMFAVEATPDQLAALAGDPRVEALWEDRLAEPTLKQSLGMIRATGPQGVHGRGAKGRGRAVAILDTGVDRSHEFVRGRIIAEACFNTNDARYAATSRCPGRAETSTRVGSGADCRRTIEGCGHGTHVAGIAAGRNVSRNGSEPAIGVAPLAGIVAVNVFTKFAAGSNACGGSGSSACVLSFSSDQIKALEHVYSLRNGVRGRRIDAVNMSLGGGFSAGFCRDALTPAFNLLRRAGIATVIASGNNGYINGVAHPACNRNAITVGASTKSNRGNPERFAYYSNQGTQVDLVAPGGDAFYPVRRPSSMILSSYHGRYKALQGTSMAAPHVAGAIALIRSKPKCANTGVAAIERALRTTGLRLADHRGSGMAEPRLDVAAAMTKLGCF